MKLDRNQKETLCLYQSMDNRKKAMKTLEASWKGVYKSHEEFQWDRDELFDYLVECRGLSIEALFREVVNFPRKNKSEEQQQKQAVVTKIRERINHHLNYIARKLFGNSSASEIKEKDVSEEVCKEGSVFWINHVRHMATPNDSRDGSATLLCEPIVPAAPPQNNAEETDVRHEGFDTIVAQLTDLVSASKENVEHNKALKYVQNAKPELVNAITSIANYNFAVDLLEVLKAYQDNDSSEDNSDDGAERLEDAQAELLQQLGERLNALRWVLPAAPTTEPRHKKQRVTL